MKTWPVFGICVIQVILLLAHWFLFHTWIEFWDAPSAAAVLSLRIAMLVLAFSFVFAALLSFKYSNALVTAIYKFAAVWLGFLNYLFFAACLSWVAWYVWAATKMSADPQAARPWIAGTLCRSCDRRRRLRHAECSRNSHTQNFSNAAGIAGKLARPSRRADERHTPGPRQRRKVQPTAGCDGTRFKAGHCFYPWRPVRRN